MLTLMIMKLKEDNKMEQLEIGNFHISKIIESVEPAFEMSFLLPGSNTEVVKEHSDWLFPNYIDADSGILILSFHSYLVRTPNYNILVDSCVGNDKERPGFPDMHRLNTDYLRKLQSAGVAPEEIDFVMCTHLHPDHVGWNTRMEDGRWVPTFPNARYLFGKTEFEAWEKYHKEIAGTADDTVPPPVSTVLSLSFNDSVLPIIEANRAIMIEDGHEVEDGFSVESAPGHAPGNFVFNLESKSDRGMLSGDLLHHPLQLVHPGWSSFFCADPLLSAQTRRQILERIADTNTVLMPAHFPTPTWGIVQSKGDGFRLKTRC
jgi:glyoxylase-like metal-dependent hydrolase (beta-lactamase superfamily II)